MSILEHCDNEYFIIMRNGTDLDSLEPGLDKLADKDIITDWEDTEFEQELSTMSDAFKNPGPQIHIFIPVKNDTEENWKTIGNTLGMSLLDLHNAKRLMTKVYRAYFEFEWDDDYEPESKNERQEAIDAVKQVKARGLTLIPKNSLWSEPLPDAEEIEDYHGGMIKLDRMSQLAEDTPDFFDLEWLENVLLFHLAGDKDNIELLQNIERLLLQTQEV